MGYPSRLIKRILRPGFSKRLTAILRSLESLFSILSKSWSGARLEILQRIKGDIVKLLMNF
jgi:hypothetical protein